MQKVFRSLSLVLLFVSLSIAQNRIPEPKDILGFTPGDDRKLASWNQVLQYFQKLEDTSPRVKFEAIGKSSMDRPFVFATISSPENLKTLEKYKQINAKLADPRLIKSNETLAKQLIRQGKTIVLVTYGIHSTEVGSTLSSMLVAHRLASSNEPEIKKILDETIILLVPSLNPDGVDIVKNWYDKTLGTPYEGTSPPELYHKYVGHDNNRDWYAFTQVETQLTVDKIHNVWHPQIVNDVHQQGANGARIFLPPYMQPVEPNVPKEIIEGYTELGNFMAESMRKNGFEGITTDSTYDAWTPARAYSHYHGGVRILTETASAKLATPIKVEFKDLRGSEGYDAKKETPNFRPVWKGGDWKLRDITKYMTASTFSLLDHAAANRESWLKRFYAIGKEAVRPRKDGENFAFILKPQKYSTQTVARGVSDEERRNKILRILSKAGVEIINPLPFQIGNVRYPRGTSVIKLAQPYGNFAKALLEKQVYPNLLDEKGNPISPYDVTAHTLSLLMNVESELISKPISLKLPNDESSKGIGAIQCADVQRNAIYKSYVPSMDEGWTRWIIDETNEYKPECMNFDSIWDNEIRKGIYNGTSSIIFPDQAPNQMLNGHAKGTMPDEYTGGIGKDGVGNLRKFVENGGTLVFLNRASNFAIEQFGLPIKNVTQGLARKDFYIPGSILRTEIDTNHPVAEGMQKESIAWFENSPAFEVLSGSSAAADGSTPNKINIIAKYPDNPKDILLSGWALGAEKIAGKSALVEVKLGKGKIVLFGFRPQYRGQSLATFPLLFNALRK